MLWVTLGPEEPEQGLGRALHVASVASVARPPVWKLASHWLWSVVPGKEAHFCVPDL